MLKEAKEFARGADDLPVAVGLLLAIATYFVIRAVVGDLICPLIGIFIGESIFQLNSFTIGGSQFPYGQLIEEVLTLVLAIGLAALTLRFKRRGSQGGSELALRDCPECLSAIPGAAKRCPDCTAAVRPVGPT